MRVIGVAGQAQMGKDSLADYLAAELTVKGRYWKRMAFASNVKKVFCENFGVDLDFVEHWKVRDEIPPGFAMTVRKSLQFIGDGFRQIQPSIWMDLTFRDINPKIISDVRYVNEFRRIRQEGGINILIGRPDKLSDDPNGSEAQIRPYVAWALETFDPFVKFVNLRTFFEKTGYEPPSNVPHISEFDIFIRNDGTLPDLHSIIDEHLVPLLQEYPV